MATRWTKGEEGALTSWGSANINATILSGMITNSCTLFVGSDTQDVTGLGAHAAVNIPGLKTWRVDFRGFAGSSAYIGNNGAITYSAGGYALHVPEFTWNASTPAVHDITEFNSGSPPEWRTYMPDIFQNSARYVAGIDADTAIVFPPAPGAALPTFTMTYKSGATLAMTGLIQRVGPAIVRGQKNMATYDVLGSGTTTAVGGVFGSHTFGGTLNGDPLWSAGGSATGAIVVTAASGRTYSGTDSFWTSLQLQCTVGGAVMVSGSIQGCGTLTAA